MPICNLTIVAVQKTMSQKALMSLERNPFTDEPQPVLLGNAEDLALINRYFQFAALSVPLFQRASSA